MKRNRRAIITSIAAMMALAIMVGAGFQSSRDLFQKALQMEEGQGDLQKAIGLYQDIVKRFPENREVAAKAQLHIGLCYEKLGNAEARKAYEGVVREYADQKETAATAQARLAALAGAGGATGSSTLSVRRVWANADVTGKVSADGRFLSFTDWKSENVAIRDLATGQTSAASRAWAVAAVSF
jgi:tetratricopeptide (TPR) repeat protein